MRELGSADRAGWVFRARTVAEARGKAAQAATLYAEGAGGWKAYGFPFEQGRALLGCGRTLLASGDREAAAPKLHEARKILASLAATWLLAETDRLLAA